MYYITTLVATQSPAQFHPLNICDSEEEEEGGEKQAVSGTMSPGEWDSDGRSTVPFLATWLFSLRIPQFSC